MGIAVSLFLFAAGAIMRYAVTVKGNGFDMHTAGVILMFVGVAGAIISAMNWASWGGFGGRHGPTTVVDSRDTTITREREVS